MLGHDASHFRALPIDLGAGFRATLYDPTTGATWVASLLDGTGGRTGAGAPGPRRMTLTRIASDGAIERWPMPVNSELTGFGGIFMSFDADQGVWTGWGTWLVRFDPATSKFRQVFVHTGPNSGSGGGPSTIRAGTISGSTIYVTQSGALKVLRYDITTSAWLAPVPIHARVTGLTTMTVANGVVYLSGNGPYKTDALLPMLVAIRPNGSSNLVHMGSGAGLVATYDGNLVSIDRSGDVSVLAPDGHITIHQARLKQVAPNLPWAADRSGDVWSVGDCTACVVEVFPSGATRTWTFPAQIIPAPVGGPLASHRITTPIPSTSPIKRATVVADPSLEAVVPVRDGALLFTRAGNMPGQSQQGGYASVYRFTP